MSTFFACPECRRHIRRTEATCPFCSADRGERLQAAPLRKLPGVRLARAAMFTFAAAGAGATGCSSPDNEGVDKQPSNDGAAEGGSFAGISGGGAGGIRVGNGAGGIYLGASGGVYGCPPPACWPFGAGGSPEPSDAAPPPVDAPSDAPADGARDADPLGDGRTTDARSGDSGD